MEAKTPPTPEDFATFGDLLKFVRRHRRLTQLELALAVGYSESQISHLEQNHRAPSRAIVTDRLIPALELEQEPPWAARLLELASPLHRGDLHLPTAPKSLAGTHNLPIHLTTFVGRQHELEEISRLLTDQTMRRAGFRIVTLAGAGGSGKTRLAVEAAGLVVSAFPDGAWWIDLASLSKPSLVPASVATVFGIKDQSSRPMVRTLTEFLRDKALLLILDNCEHLISASATLVDSIVRECTTVQVLVTSREVLNVPGEVRFNVPSLSTPTADRVPNVLQMPEYEAVRLFTDRAAAVSPAFQLTSENTGAVAQICLRLDGIPLAIELAAARLRMLSAQQIAEGLDDRFQLLSGGSRTAPARHRTLQALVDWSYDLLSEPERALLCQLSVFAGGWTLEAARALARTEPATERNAIRLLGQLIDKSLVVVEHDQEDVRYRMLETIRQYAHEKLSASPHHRTLERAHAVYFLEMAKRDRAGDPWFYPNHTLHEILQAEHDNLRAALTWCQSPAGDAQLGIELVAALLRFWFERGYWNEWRGWGEGALTTAASLPASAALARVHFGQGTVLAFQSEFRASSERFETSLRLYQELGDVPWSVYVTYRLGWVARERGDAATARRLMESSLAQFRALGDNARVAEVLVTLAEVAVMVEDTAWANELLDEGMSMQTTPEGMGPNLPWALNHRGHVAQLEADLVRARELHTTSLELFSAFGGQHSGMAWAHHGLGETALALGDAENARGHLKQALELFRDLGDRMGMCWCLAGLGAVAAFDGQHELAATLWGAGEALRESIGARSAPATRRTHERLYGSSRAKLGDAHTRQWVRQGSTMQHHDAVAAALALEF